MEIGQVVNQSVNPQSESVKNIVPALLKAQMEFKPVEKNKVNPYFKSKYADLETVWDAVSPALHKNGITVTQPTGFYGNMFGVFTTLYHTSGEWMRGFYVLNPSKPNDPQALLATLTYARRGALSAMLSIVTEDDTDGEQTAGHSPAHVVATSPARPKVNGGATTITDPQQRRFYAIWNKNGWTKDEVKDLLTEYGFNSDREITMDAYEEICNAVESNPKQVTV